MMRRRLSSQALQLFGAEGSKGKIHQYATRLASTAASPSPGVASAATGEARSGTTNPAPGPPKPNSPFTIFDRATKQTQRSRAATREGGETSRVTDYVRDEAVANLVERLYDVKRNFGTIVELGSGAGYVRKHLDAKRTGTSKVIMCDMSKEALDRDLDQDSQYPDLEFERMVIDEEELPFAENSIDCIVSTGTLHWTNDLPGALVQICRSLKPDGIFIGAMCGGDTLFELRTSLQLAEQEREGGISPRISPMADSRDMVSLLGRAGFNIPTVDTDEIEVVYPGMYELLADLRDMGESNAVINRRPFLKRDTLVAASAIYPALHGNEDGSIPATYGIIYMVGWKPDESQRKPLPRGTATKSMKEVLGTGAGGD